MIAISLTTNEGHGLTRFAAPLAERVSLWRGGIWLVPHTGNATTNEHYHGILVGADPETVITVWLAEMSGTAARKCQRAEEIYDLPGWLGYCRREAGFFLESIIVSGLLRDPWHWALGRSGVSLRSGELRDVTDAGHLDPVMLADTLALHRTMASLTRPPPAIASPPAPNTDPS